MLIPGWKIAWWVWSALARLRAISASRSRTPGSATPGAPITMPMLALRKTSRPSTLNGSRRTASSSPGKVAGLAARGDPVEHHRELVAAEAGDGVAGPDCPEEPLADLGQEAVADRVPERLVDHREAHEVEQDHGDRIVIVEADPGQRMGAAIQEERPVGQAGDRVVERSLADLLLEPAPLAQVVDRDDPGRRPVGIWAAPAR